MTLLKHVAEMFKLSTECLIMGKNINQVFKTTDKMDSVAFPELPTGDVKFRFSNNKI